MKILNFGSLNIDYVYQMDHFVQAGETESSMRRDIFPGGKGLNQSVALARSESEVFHAGGIGKNDGKFLKQLLEDSSVNTKYINEIDGTTGHAIIQVNKKGNNCILLYSGANGMQEKSYIDKVLENFGRGDYLVLQNEINNLRYIADCAYKKGMIIFLNPSPYNNIIDELDLDHIHYFLLNEIEAASMCGVENCKTEELISILRKRFPNSIFVLTLGKEGVIYFDSQISYSHGIYDVDVVDTTAAGDTFSGYFISSISKGVSIEESLRLASIASSLVVSRRGAAVSIPTLKEVKESTLKLI